MFMQFVKFRQALFSLTASYCYFIMDLIRHILKLI